LFPHHRPTQIIKRARQNHLLEKFREETKGVSPELITQVHAAWRNHVREQLRKGLPVADAPKEGDEDSAWPRLAELIQNKDWKQECLRRDEKFDMNFSSAVCPTISPFAIRINSYSGVTDVRTSQSQTLAALEVARAQLSTGNHSQEAAHKLIADSKDILSQALDDQVCCDFPDRDVRLSCFPAVQINGYGS
jgi:cysteinyl-tRNA synthetase